MTAATRATPAHGPLLAVDRSRRTFPRLAGTPYFRSIRRRWPGHTRSGASGRRSGGRSMSGRPDVPGRDASPQDSMLEPRQEGRPPQAPTVAAPAPYADRRRTFRRAEDRIAHQEKVLLARALDVLASDDAAEERLAGLLRLLGKTAGARRVAVIADGVERRAAVGRRRGRGSGRRRGAGRLARRERPTVPRPACRRGARADLADRRRRTASTRTPRTARPDAPVDERRTTRRPTDRPATTRCCRSRPPAT